MSKVIPLAKINQYPAKHIKRYRQEVVASGILIKDGQVLLIRRSKQDFPSPGGWGLPGGGVEPLETPMRAAAREFWEETHIKVKAEKLLTVENYFYDQEDVRTHIIELIYQVKPLTKRIIVILSNEHDAYRFVSLRELNDYHSLALPRKKVIKTVLRISK